MTGKSEQRSNSTKSEQTREKPLENRALIQTIWPQKKEKLKFSSASKVTSIGTSTTLSNIREKIAGKTSICKKCVTVPFLSLSTRI